MYSERYDYRDLDHLHEICKKSINFHVILTMADGSTLDGIIEDVDNTRIIIWVGEDVMDNNEVCDDKRQPFGHGGPQRRRRMFRRRNFPLNALAALAFVNYPFFAPIYPFYYPF